MPNEAEIAWAAGLFEGEGCFHTSQRQSGKWAVQVRLGMTDRETVDRFAHIVGVGRIHRSREWKKHPEWKPMYEWYSQSGPDVMKVIDLLLPWLGSRRAKKALEVRRRAAAILPYGHLRTHCKRGHPYEGDNLLIEPSGVRRCRTCRTEQSRARARKRLGITPDRYRVKEES